MPLPADLRLALLELTHLLDTLVRRPLPLGALAARDLARFNATLLLTLSRTRAVLDEPAAELPAHDFDPPAWFPPPGLRDRLQHRSAERLARDHFEARPRMPHP